MAEPSEMPRLPMQIVAERTHLTIPSLPNWIEPTVEFLRQKAVMGGACQESRSKKLLVALHEAVTNAMVHGNLEVSSDLKEQGNSVFAEALAQRAADSKYAGRAIDIVVDNDGQVCRWIITDQGRGFDVERVLARCLSNDPEVLLASGRGILMMKSFLDEVRFALDGRRVILSLARQSGEERRRDTRVPVHTPFQVTPIGPDGEPDWTATYDAISRNFSEHGVSLLQQQLETSGKVLIGIPTEKGILHVPAEVKHTRILGEHGMELGCRFAEPLTAEEAQRGSVPPQEAVREVVGAILESCKSKALPGHEKREHPRVVFNERVTMQMPGRSDMILGYARDLSKGGIALIAQEPLPAEITITFAATPTRPPAHVKCRVVRCSLIQEGFYDVGATFLGLDAK